MSGSGLMERMSRLGNTVFAQSAADGALPSLYAATAPEVRAGSSSAPTGLFGMRGSPKPVAFLRRPGTPERPGRLWEVSEEPDRGPVPDPRPARLEPAGDGRTGRSSLSQPFVRLN